MSTETLIRQAVKGALALGTAGSMAGAGAAMAQAPAPAAGTSGGATQLSKIIVTGSHIPRTSIATAEPVITINRSQIDNTGFTTVGQLMQNLTSSGSALNVQFNNGGNGSVAVNLHDLGSNRVLVLVNGQRWIPTISGYVDLSTIPLAVVQRVEVLQDGASAVYGSEAIAGVVNIITVKNYSGAEAHAYMGMYDGHGDGGGWDGKTQQYSFTVGTTSDRSSVLLSAGYYNQNPVWAGQRTISKEPYIQGGQNVGSANIPGGFVDIYSGNGAIPSFPGCGTGSYYGYPGCQIAGPMTGPNANPHPYTSADNYNYAPLNYLRTPSERWYAFTQGHYDITDNVTFHATMTYQRRNSHQILAPNPWALGVYGYTANGLPIGISATNPYNPFGQDLVPGYPGSSVANAWCNKFGTGTTAGTCTTNWQTLAYFGFRPLTSGVRDFNQNQATFYFNGGFDGYWTMFDNQWSWNTNYIYGNTLDTTITSGLADTSRMQAALGPLASCNALPGCVPLDMFGGPSQQTPNQLGYVKFTAHDITNVTVRDYTANIGGNFWNSWYAGPWGVAAGYEYQETDAFFSPDPLISEGNTVGNVVQPTSGRQSTSAQYAELNIPLASNMPFAKELGVDLANRWSQFHWNGTGNVLQGGQINTAPAEGRSHASTGRVALKWRPFNQLLIRASWSQGFRIPSISELFGGASDSYPSVVDPCATTGTLPPGCNGVVHTQPNGQIRSTIGGSAQLNPETAITRSAGFVYSPSWAPGLDFSADYFKIELENQIARLGAQFYLDQCYINSDPTACSHVITSGNGKQVTNIIDLQNNGGSRHVNGWDINFKYRFPTTAIGDFALNGSLTFTKTDVTCGNTCTDFSGTASGQALFGQPKHRYNFGLDWNYGAWSATWNVYVIGPMWESCAANAGYIIAALNATAGQWCSDPQKYVAGQQVGQNHLGTTVYHDVQASYRVSSWNTTFTLGVNNLFDKLPPISRSAFANSYLPVYYRTPGRFFYGRVSVNF